MNYSFDDTFQANTYIMVFLEFVLEIYVNMWMWRYHCNVSCECFIVYNDIESILFNEEIDSYTEKVDYKICEELGFSVRTFVGLHLSSKMAMTPIEPRSAMTPRGLHHSKNFNSKIYDFCKIYDFF